MSLIKSAAMSFNRLIGTFNRLGKASQQELDNIADSHPRFFRALGNAASEHKGSVKDLVGYGNKYPYYAPKVNKFLKKLEAYGDNPPRVKPAPIPRGGAPEFDQAKLEAVMADMMTQDSHATTATLPRSAPHYINTSGASVYHGRVMPFAAAE